jgi:hypothetical protein
VIRGDVAFARAVTPRANIRLTLVREGSRWGVDTVSGLQLKATTR